MTIRPGEEWGEVVAEPDEGETITGDLAREIGVDERALRPHEAIEWRLLPLDVLVVETTDSQGHRGELRETSWITAGQPLFGPFVVVASTSFVHGRRLFSRAHPNDGRFEWFSLSPRMGLRQRIAFRHRTRTETHLPHPDVTTGSGAEFRYEFARPTVVRASSGARIRDVLQLRVTINVDAARLYLPICRIEP